MRSPLAAAMAALLGLSLSSALPVAASTTRSATQQFTLGANTPRAATFEMTARGTVTIEPDGSVSEATLDMPRETRKAYLEAIRAWTFRPVVIDGRPVRAVAHFMIEATAKPMEGAPDRVQLGFDNVWFLDPPEGKASVGERSARNELSPPRYPQRAADYGYGAEVRLLVKLDDSGRVIDAGVIGLALGVSSIQGVGRAETFARQFAESSVSAAKSWVIRDPASIEAGAAIVPVVFSRSREAGGSWQPRIPLDVTPLPWMVAASGKAVAFTPGGEASSSRFKLVEDVTGATIN